MVSKRFAIFHDLNFLVDFLVLFRFRLEVSFNTITPQASGGAVSITLRMIVPESWKDESKPPKPW